MNRAVAALALLMMLPVPGAGAQGEPVPLLDDGSGDLMAEVGGSPSEPPAGRFTAVDLVSLSVEETRQEFVFTLEVDELDPDAEAPILESTFYGIDFRNGHKDYRIAVSRFVSTEAFYYAQLEGYDAGRDDYFQVAVADVTADTGADTLTIEVARNDLSDENGAAPFPGQPFTHFVVGASSNSYIDFTTNGQRVQGLVVTDQMPDDGPGDAVLPILIGAAQAGHARLRSDLPFRASNGEATTFVYDVQATNLAAEEDRFGLAIAGAPAGWDVRLPGGAITVPANGTVRFPVVAAIPFQHNHGSVVSFTVELKSLSDAGTVGRVELGVRFVDPPQPAGHHSDVFLHSVNFAEGDQVNEAFCTIGSCTAAYLNTLEKDDLDDGVPVPGRQIRFGGSDGPTPKSTFYWSVPLSPGLELGLDFDLSRTGTVAIPFRANAPIVDGTLEGQLVHTSPSGNPDDDFLPAFLQDGRSVVARLERVSALQVNPNTDFQYEPVLTPTEDGDYLPFEMGASLFLELYLNATAIQPFGGLTEGQLNPMLLSGGAMTLPLLEYHDPVNSTFSSLGDLALVADSAQERQVNPGDTVLFNFTLANGGAIDQGLRLNVTGDNAGWARLLGDSAITVQGGEERRIVVAVTAPKKANEGDHADLVLNVVSASDPNVRALGRMVAHVNTTAELADESGLVEGLDDELSKGKGAPGPGLLLGLAALGAAAAVARRNGLRPR